MEALDFLCLNCQNLIREDLVNRHSQICTEVQPLLLRMEQDSMKLINLKIDKLKCALETCEHRETQANQPLLTRLSQLCVSLILTEQDRLQETCRNVTVEVERILMNFQGSLCVRLYGERLRLLAQEKFTELANGPQESLEAKVERKRREAELLREQVEYYRKRSHQLQVGEVSSVLERHSSWEDPLYSSEDVDIQEPIPSVEVPPNTSEDLQRYFYSQCLQVKMAFGTRHPAQGVPLPVLYQKAQQEKVPMHQWAQFIRTELSRAGE